MKKLLLWSILCLVCVMTKAQSYTVTSAGTADGGRNLVHVVVTSKKNLKVSSEDAVKQYAVRGVLFDGIAAAEGYGAQTAIVKDPNVEQTKKAFFDAFWKEGAYKRYAALVPATLTVMKNKQIKAYETQATVIVDKAGLQKYLEESGIIKGFSNLW
ncbi:MAG: hypothetical protein J5971_02850 [Prevotella sp.]|nr:hypothetical protein [Prevotella sp.]